MSSAARRAGENTPTERQPGGSADPAGPVAAEHPEEILDSLLRHLRTAREGLSTREASRRLAQYGPNQLRRRGGRRWPRELGRQLTHPLALLLWLAAALS